MHPLLFLPSYAVLVLLGRQNAEPLVLPQSSMLNHCCQYLCNMSVAQLDCALSAVHFIACFGYHTHPENSWSRRQADMHREACSALKLLKLLCGVLFSCQRPTTLAVLDLI